MIAGEPRAGRKLRWCATHSDVAWLYGDGSVGCTYDLVVEQSSTDHELTDIPSELLQVESGTKST